MIDPERGVHEAGVIVIANTQGRVSDDLVCEECAWSLGLRKAWMAVLRKGICTGCDAELR